MNRGGVVFGAGGQLHFLPALVIQQIIQLPAITRIPAAPPELAGVAQTEGEIVPVIRIGDTEQGLLLVCSYMGEPIAVIGQEIVGVGHYEVDPDHPESIVVGEARAKALDLGKIYARIQAGG